MSRSSMRKRVESLEEAREKRARWTVPELFPADPTQCSLELISEARALFGEPTYDVEGLASIDHHGLWPEVQRCGKELEKIKDRPAVAAKWNHWCKRYGHLADMGWLSKEASKWS